MIENTTEYMYALGDQNNGYYRYYETKYLKSAIAEFNQDVLDGAFEALLLEGDKIDDAAKYAESVRYRLTESANFHFLHYVMRTYDIETGEEVGEAQLITSVL